MNIKKHIPNFLTCCNLLCGVYGIQVLLTVNSNEIKSGVFIVIYAIIFAVIFDFLDGFAARAFNVSSPIGKELDSLADMVSFGVLPGFLLFQLMSQNVNMFPFSGKYASFLPYLAYLIPVFSALRLAKFNVDVRQTTKFIGLPTPANTLFISGIAFVYTQENNPIAFMASPIAFLLFCFLLSYLLVADLPLIALKFKSFGWKENKLRFILIISSIVFLLTLNLTAIPIIIILYLLLSIVDNIWLKTL